MTVNQQNPPPARGHNNPAGGQNNPPPAGQNNPPPTDAPTAATAATAAAAATAGGATGGAPAVHVPQFNPKVRSNPLIGSAAYTWDDLGRFHFVTVDPKNTSTELIARLQDQRSEHHLGIKKVRLASKFSAPKITNFNTLSDLDGHCHYVKNLDVTVACCVRLFSLSLIP